MTASPDLSARRPRRADARRNFDALVGAARGAFAELGPDAPLEEIARRAGVGIATLYRNFPSRDDLIENVYIDEVEAVCRTADDVAGLEPWVALESWLKRFVDYLGTKHPLIDGLNQHAETLLASRAALYAAGGPLLARAQAAGVARGDASIDDVLRLVTGITAAGFVSEEQRDRVLAMALDGVRVRA